MDLLKKVVFVSLFAAIIAVCGFISIPVPGTPIPIVLQNMLVVITGGILGPVLGICSTLLFLALGAIGLPIFSGGSGGIARFMGPTGGFLYGYALATLVTGLILRKPRVDKKTPLWLVIIAVICGFVVMYVPGVIHFMLTLDKTFKDTMILCVIPYIPFDLFKIVISIFLLTGLRKQVARVLFNDDDSQFKEVSSKNVDGE